MPTPQEIERILGEQYATAIANAPKDVRADCKEVINTSLDLMDHAMRVSLTLRSWAIKGKPAMVQATLPVMHPPHQNQAAS